MLFLSRSSIWFRSAPHREGSGTLQRNRSPGFADHRRIESPHLRSDAASAIAAIALVRSVLIHGFRRASANINNAQRAVR